MSCVRVCESYAHPVFNQSSGGSFSWIFLLPATKKNNDAAKDLDFNMIFRGF